MMKRFLLSAPILFLLAACGDGTEVNVEVRKKGEPLSKEWVEKKYNWRHSETDDEFIIDMMAYTANLVYTQDARTGLCFAFQFRRMTNIPCEAIPSNLLNVVHGPKASDNHKDIPGPSETLPQPSPKLPID